MDYGETPADAAIRELGEETGLIGRIDRVAGVDSVTGRWTRGDGVVEDFHGIRIVYRVAITGGELRDEPHGSTDTCGWVTRDEAASLPLVDLAHYGLRLAYEED